MPIDALRNKEEKTEGEKILIKPIKAYSKKFQVNIAEFPRIVDYLKTEGYKDTAKVCEIDFILPATKLKIRFMDGRIFFIPFSDSNAIVIGFLSEMFYQEIKDKIIKFKNEKSIDGYIKFFSNFFEFNDNTLIIVKKDRIYFVSTENELENIRLDSDIIITKVNLKNQQKEDVKQIDSGIIEINAQNEQRLEEIVEKFKKDLNLHNPISKHYYEMVGKEKEFKLRN
jgi:hypothetical protein